MLEICWAAMAVKRAQLTDFSRKGERGRVHVGRCVFMVNNINAVYICIYIYDVRLPSGYPSPSCAV